MWSPEVVVPEERPVHDVEQDEAGGEEPPRDAVHQHRLLPSLLHQVTDFFLFLGMSILHRIQFIINDDIKIPFPVVHSILIRRECISYILIGWEANQRQKAAAEVRLMCEDDILNYSI